MENNIFTSDSVITYNENSFVQTDIPVKNNTYIFTLKDINEANINQIGYIDQDKIFVIRYLSMKKTVDGYDVGMRPDFIMYLYHNVPVNLYEGMLTAKDKVKFFNTYIKGHFMFHTEFID